MLWVSEHGRILRGKANACVGQGDLELSDEDFDACLDLLNDSGESGEDFEPIFTYARPHGRDQLKVHNHVGVLRTPAGTQIEILPKVSKRTDAHTARGLLVKMLLELTNSPFRSGTSADLQGHRMPLFEILMRQFLEHTAQIVRKGIARTYVQTEENLVYLRGKLRMNEHIRRNATLANRFWCGYDEFEADRPINRLVRGALDVVARVAQDPQNQQLCRELLFYFDRVPATRSPAEDFGGIRKERALQHYDPAMPSCMLILEGLNPLTLQGKRRALAVLFPMERVFEDYVAVKLRAQLKGWKVLTQVSGGALVEQHLGRKMFNLIPDLEIRRGSVRVIADTKWKLLDANDRPGRYGISQADVYQLFAYSRKYLSGQPRREVYLIYPKTETFQAPLAPFWYRTMDEVLYVLPYDLEGDQLVLDSGCALATIHAPVNLAHA